MGPKRTASVGCADKQMRTTVTYYVNVVNLHKKNIMPGMTGWEKDTLGGM